VRQLKSTNSGNTENVKSKRIKQPCRRNLETAEFDPGCVKTHTSAKCRKHNSPARHRTSRVQYDLTLTDAIARRYFYVWRDRWSFRTAKTQTGRAETLTDTRAASGDQSLARLELDQCWLSHPAFSSPPCAPA
jgi:hypothetical protein